MIRIKIWGATGSIPAQMSQQRYKEKIIHALLEGGKKEVRNRLEAERVYESLPMECRYYTIGNSTCYEIQGLNDVFILDAGSGIRNLGIDLFAKRPDKKNINLFFSHFHWDHIMGLPFFGPIYHPGYHLHFFAGHPRVEEKLADQQVPQHFPVKFHETASQKSFYDLQPKESYDIGGARVSILPLRHPGGSYAYRFEVDSKVIVYATDGEYPSKEMSEEKFKTYIDFFRGADVLIFDAMYTFPETELSKADWGHSSPNIGVELAVEAEVKHLILSHHEPVSSDADNFKKTKGAKQYRDIYCRNYKKRIKPKISLAIEEGMIDF